MKGDSAARIAFLRNIIESLPGHLEGTLPFFGPFMVPPEEREKILKDAPQLKTFLNAFWRMDEEDQQAFSASEFTHQGHVDDRCFLWYYARRCCAQDVLRLPESRTYRIEAIGAWNMTRETIAENASGEVWIDLPSQPYIAVLATAQHEKEKP